VPAVLAVERNCRSVAAASVNQMLAGCYVCTPLLMPPVDAAAATTTAAMSVQTVDESRGLWIRLRADFASVLRSDHK